MCFHWASSCCLWELPDVTYSLPWISITRSITWRTKGILVATFLFLLIKLGNSDALAYLWLSTLALNFYDPPYLRSPWDSTMKLIGKRIGWIVFFTFLWCSFFFPSLSDMLHFSWLCIFSLSLLKAWEIQVSGYHVINFVHYSLCPDDLFPDSPLTEL